MTGSKGHIQPANPKRFAGLAKKKP